MTYEEALEYIHGISWTFCKPGLERTAELCRRLGDPQRGLKFIHVAGTNGKGSFSAMISSVLTECGLKVGLYTSPYILRFNERMKINGADIPDGRLAEITERVRPIADSMADKPTEFELITAIAFTYFAEEGADIVVLECGMGGRLDSTNVIETPLLSVITGISLDHTAFLGDTVAAIAAEKGGIIKHGCPVLLGGESDEAFRVISGIAREKGCELATVDYSRLHVRSMSTEGTLLDYLSHRDIIIPLLGIYQPRNTALVLTALDILRQYYPQITEKAIHAGLRAARWPARFEIICSSPLTIFDGAHNPEGIRVAVESIRQYFPGERVIIVSGVLADKDYRYIASEVCTVAEAVYTMTPPSPRALTAEEYAAVIQKNGVRAVHCPSVAAAMHAALNEAKAVQKPVICLGSLYTYSEVRSALNI